MVWPLSSPALRPQSLAWLSVRTSKQADTIATVGRASLLMKNIRTNAKVNKLVGYSTVSPGLLLATYLFYQLRLWFVLSLVWFFSRAHDWLSLCLSVSLSLSLSLSRSATKRMTYRLQVERERRSSDMPPLHNWANSIWQEMTNLSSTTPSISHKAYPLLTT